jgi:hypothetical protein
MAFIPVQNCIQLYARFLQQNQTCYNVFHFYATDPADLAVHALIATTYKNWFFNEMRVNVSTELTLNALYTRNLADEFAGGIVFTTDLPTSGLDVRQAMPMNVTVAISWRTALIGKSYRGRTYHLGLTAGQVTDSSLNGPVLVSLQNAYTALVQDFIIVAHRMVVASRYQNKAPRPGGGIVTNIETVSIDSTLDSQRRRLPGRGR